MCLTRSDALDGTLSQIWCRRPGGGTRDKYGASVLVRNVAQLLKELYLSVWYIRFLGYRLDRLVCLAVQVVVFAVLSIAWKWETIWLEIGMGEQCHKYSGLGATICKGSK